MTRCPVCGYDGVLISPLSPLDNKLVNVSTGKNPTHTHDIVTTPELFKKLRWCKNPDVPKYPGEYTSRCYTEFDPTTGKIYRYRHRIQLELSDLVGV